MSEEADAALMVDGNSAAGVRVIAERDAPGDLVAGLSIAPEIELLDSNAVDPSLAGLIGLGFALVFFMTTRANRSEEHTSELQSRGHLVCRLLLEKKKKNH